MLPLEHSAILLTFIKLPFVIKIFVLSIFEWQLKTGFTVYATDLISRHFLDKNIDRKKVEKSKSYSKNSQIFNPSYLPKSLDKQSDPDKTDSEEAA